MSYNQGALKPLTNAYNQINSGPTQGIDATWTIKDRIRYSEAAYQEILALRATTLEQRNYGKP